MISILFQRKRKNQNNLKENDGMDKYEFMGVVQECFDNCNDEQLEMRKNEMIEVIEKMFKLESDFRKYEKKN